MSDPRDWRLLVRVVVIVLAILLAFHFFTLTFPSEGGFCEVEFELGGETVHQCVDAA